MNDIWHPSAPSVERIAQIRRLAAEYNFSPAYTAIRDLLAALDTHVWKPTHDICIACQGTIKPTWVCQGCGSVGAVLEDVEPGIQAAYESATTISGGDKG